MLDKHDLKQISQIVDEKLDKRITPLEKGVKVLEKDMKVLKKDMGETRNDIKTLIAYFDRDYVGLRKRVEAIEEHLGFTSAH